MPARAARTLRILIALSVALATAVQAQDAERPPLPRGADPNDWEAYYDSGLALLMHKDPGGADQAFTWASHLRPDRAVALYARWIAFWAQDVRRFGDYLSDDEKVLRDPQVIRMDSLRTAAIQRNPFVHQGLVIYLYNPAVRRVPRR